MTLISKAAALALGTALVSGSVAGVPTAVAATGALPASSPADLAASWMTGNLTDGVLLTGTNQAKNFDLTLELGQALVAVGGHDEALASIDEALQQHVVGYTGGQALKPAQTTRALMFVTTAGGNAQAYGPEQTDLVAASESLLVTDQAYTGRLQGGSAWIQAYAAAGLTAVDSAQAPAVVDYTLQQQCAAGFFRLSLARLDDPNQACDGSSDATRPGSVDVTAAIVGNLAPVAERDPEAAAALARAGEWLLTQQQPDGSFLDTWTKRANANSTGLAAWALGLTGQTEAAAEAATWLRTRQVVGACAPEVADETGAIAYSDEAWTDGVEHGFADPRDRMQWLMVGSQALAGIAHAPHGVGPVDVVVADRVDPGSTVTVTVTGLAPGERACLGGPVSQPLLGTGEAFTFQFPAGDAPGSHRVSLHTAAGPVQRDVAVATAPTPTPTPTVDAWPAATFSVKAPRRVVRGTKARVVVRGAAPREELRIKVRGRTFQRTADARGAWRGKVRVAGKPGRTKVTVTGQDTDRRGTATVRIVRR